MKPPCLNCKERWIDVEHGTSCHSNCGDYSLYASQQKMISEKRRQQLKCYVPYRERSKDDCGLLRHKLD